MTGVSQQMAASAEETSSQATVVSASAEQVSRNVETVATGIEEMTSSIREIAQSANEAAKVATTAVEVAETTTGTIAQLDESSARISDVTKVITSISEQTNLLALNATIEAARAGEAGKGFAVVANEVKELAKETASATEEIGKRVEAIQQDTGSAVAAINQIAMIIRQIHETQNTIASAVEEQTATTNEIGRSVSEVAKGSSDIASTISGVATATQDTAAGASSTQQAAQELAAMADELSGWSPGSGTRRIRNFGISEFRNFIANFVPLGAADTNRVRRRCLDPGTLDGLGVPGDPLGKRVRIRDACGGACHFQYCLTHDRSHRPTMPGPTMLKVATPGNACGYVPHAADGSATLTPAFAEFRPKFRHSESRPRRGRCLPGARRFAEPAIDRLPVEFGVTGAGLLPREPHLHRPPAHGSRMCSGRLYHAHTAHPTVS